MWSYTSTPQYGFVAWCFVKHRDDFAICLYVTLHLYVLPTQTRNMTCYKTDPSSLRPKKSQVSNYSQNLVIWGSVPKRTD